jgi:hypothetical protein
VQEDKVSRFTVAVLLMTVPVAAWASPSLLGPTGLLLTPSAEVLGTAQWNVGGSLLSSDSQDVSALYASVGVLKGMEIGLAQVSPEDGEAGTFVNAKLLLPQPIPMKLSVALGVIDLTDQIDTTPYVVVSHTIGGGLILQHGAISSPQVHVGLGSGQLDGLFGGVSARIGDRVSVMAEYDGNQINLGARLPIARNVEVTAAALDGLSDFGVGVSVGSPW